MLGYGDYGLDDHIGAFLQWRNTLDPETDEPFIKPVSVLNIFKTLVVLILSVYKVALAREILGKVNAEDRELSTDLMGSTAGRLYVELVHVYLEVRLISSLNNFRLILNYSGYLPPLFNGSSPRPAEHEEPVPLHC